MSLEREREKLSYTTHHENTHTLSRLIALPALAADTTIVGKVVGVHDGDTLTLRTEDETLKVTAIWY